MTKIFERLTNRSGGASKRERESLFEKLLRMNPTYRRLSREVEQLERETQARFEKIVEKNPEIGKAADEFMRRDGWKKYI